MNLNNFLSPIAFLLLFFLMLLYWSQAAFFGQEKYKTFNNFIFLLSILSLTMLLVTRWIESGHFPLSNLYESLLFLSWCFLTLKFLFGSRKPNILNVFYGSSLPFNRSSKKDPSKINPVSDFSFDLKKHESKENSTFLDFSDLGLGVILSPLSLLTFGFAFLSLPKEMQQSTALVPALQSNWLMMHVTVMILSYALLFSGSILSIAFLILTRFFGVGHVPLALVAKSPSSLDQVTPVILMEQEKARQEGSSRFSPDFYEGSSNENFFINLSSEAICPSQLDKSSLINLPWWRSPLPQNSLGARALTTRLDNYSYRILALAFPLLTIGILSGAVWANEAWGSYWSWDPKETWALITWLVFAIYLHTRITKGWSGEKPAIVASVGFVMVWFCYLGVNLLGTGLHSYGWFSN